jgi:hypothetical protein
MDCGSTTHQSSRYIAYLEKVMEMLNRKNMTSKHEFSRGIPESVTFLLEIDDLKNFSPKILSSYGLLYFYEGISDDLQDFQNFWKRIVKKQAIFARYEKYCEFMY